MVNLLYKVVSLSGLCFTFFIIYNLSQLSLNEGKHLFKPYIDTRFSENFSFEKFNMVKNGMTKNQVEILLGQPFYKVKGYQIPNTVTYQYTTDGNLYSQGKKGDFSWSNITVTLDSSEVVIAKGESWLED